MTNVIECRPPAATPDIRSTKFFDMVAAIFAGGLIAACVSWAYPARAANHPNALACVSVHTAAQLQAMKNNLAGIYCLMNDIDAGPIANFVPIGTHTEPFTGRFHGNGHIIRNLKVQATGSAGLFGEVSDSTIQDVGLVNAQVSSASDGVNLAGVGALVGYASGSSRLERVHTTGKVTCSAAADGCYAGGLVGLPFSVTIVDAWSAAAVAGGTYAGGLIGSAGLNITVHRSFATGDVTCDGPFCAVAGGLAGGFYSNGVVTESYATGRVHCGTANCQVGGFAGLNYGATMSNVYASGSVTGGVNSFAGGLVGQLATGIGVVRSSFAVGSVSAGDGSSIGGLIALIAGTPTVADSYWDMDTTRQATSTGGLGTGLTTVQLRSALPPGFAPGAWGITKSVSYPFLNSEGFSSNLAAVVVTTTVVTALPIVQSDLSQYKGQPVHTDGASLATVYTMMARAAGEAGNIGALIKARIDYYWHDATRTTTLTGAITNYIAIEAMKPIAPAVRLNGNVVIGALKVGRWVILRGTYKKANGGTATHYMLATMYSQYPNGVPALVFANDPFTGEQVAIDPVTKKVVQPQGFPLAGFIVDGYAPIHWKVAM